MNDTPKAFLVILNEVAIVTSAIRPDLCAFTMPHVSTPLTSILDLAFVNCLIAQLYLQILLSNQILAILIVPLELSQVLQLLHHDRVLVVRGVVAILARVLRVEVFVGVQKDSVVLALGHETSSVRLDRHDLHDIRRRENPARHFRVTWERYVVRIKLSVRILDCKRVWQVIRRTELI